MNLLNLLNKFLVKNTTNTTQKMKFCAVQEPRMSIKINPFSKKMTQLIIPQFQLISWCRKTDPLNKFSTPGNKLKLRHFRQYEFIITGKYRKVVIKRKRGNKHFDYPIQGPIFPFFFNF